MTQQVNVRRATTTDVTALVAFNRAMAMETEGRELETAVVTAGVQSLLGRPELGFYLIAECSGEVAASLMVTSEWSDWRNGLFWWIQSVYVKPDYRRRGLYRQLYRQVKQLAAERGDVCGFRLYVEKDNRQAQQTYAALGMRETAYKLFEEAGPTRSGSRF